MTSVGTSDCDRTRAHRRPWLAPLQRVRRQGRVLMAWNEGALKPSWTCSRCPSAAVRVGVYQRLAKLMAELGWTAVRVRDLTRGGYKEQVRGYCRDDRCKSKRSPSHFIA
jgi:hypothetical protein